MVLEPGVVGEGAFAAAYGVPPPARRHLGVEDLHLEDVARARAVDGDGAGQDVRPGGAAVPERGVAPGLGPVRGAAPREPDGAERRGDVEAVERDLAGLAAHRPEAHDVAGGDGGDGGVRRAPSEESRARARGGRGARDGAGRQRDVGGARGGVGERRSGGRVSVPRGVGSMAIVGARARTPRSASSRARRARRARPRARRTPERSPSRTPARFEPPPSRATADARATFGDPERQGDPVVVQKVTKSTLVAAGARAHKLSEMTKRLSSNSSRGWTPSRRFNSSLLLLLLAPPPPPRASGTRSRALRRPPHRSRPSYDITSSPFSPPSWRWFRGAPRPARPRA